LGSIPSNEDSGFSIAQPIPHYPPNLSRSPSPLTGSAGREAVGQPRTSLLVPETAGANAASCGASEPVSAIGQFLRSGLITGPREVTPGNTRPAKRQRNQDLGEVVAARPQGRVPTKLNWSVLSDEDFERLILLLITDVDGYENPEWLQHTYAPDRGRDLSVMKADTDLSRGYGDIVSLFNANTGYPGA